MYFPSATAYVSKTERFSIVLVLISSQNTITTYWTGSAITTSTLTPISNAANGTIGILLPSATAYSTITTAFYNGTAASTSVISQPTGGQDGTVELLLPAFNLVMSSSDDYYLLSPIGLPDADPNSSDNIILVSDGALPTMFSLSADGWLMTTDGRIGSNQDEDTLWLDSVAVFDTIGDPDAYSVQCTLTNAFGTVHQLSCTSDFDNSVFSYCDVDGPEGVALYLSSSVLSGCRAVTVYAVPTGSPQPIYTTTTITWSPTPFATATSVISQPSGTTPGEVEVFLPPTITSTTFVAVTAAAYTSTIPASGTAEGTVLIGQPSAGYVTITSLSSMPTTQSLTQTVVTASDNTTGTIQIVQAHATGLQTSYLSLY